MGQYGELKGQLMSLTGALVALGTATSLALGGLQLATPFALGGCSALLYQRLLQAGVEGMVPAGAAGAYHVPPAARPLPRAGSLELGATLALANPLVRLGLTGAGLLASFAALHAMSSLGGTAPNGELEFHQILAAFAGFMTYKIALVMVASAARPEPSLLSDARGRSADALE